MSAASRALFLTYLIVCIAGCLYQIIPHVMTYFNYRTSTKIDSSISDSVRYPGMVACFPFRSLIQDPTIDLDNLTIRQIFQLSPEPVDALHSCRFDSESRKRSTCNQSECVQYFSIFRHFMCDSVCYQFHPKKKLGLFYSVSRIANALKDSHRVYDLYLSEELNVRSFIYIFAYVVPTEFQDAYEEGPLYPYLSDKYAENVAHYTDGINKIILRTQDTEYRMLPLPYDTACKTREQTYYYACMETEMEAKIRRFPASSSTSNHLDIKPISIKDMHNTTVSTVVNAAHDKCLKGLADVWCHSILTATNADSYKSFNQPRLRITISVPLQPTIEVTYYKLMTLVDMIYYVSGCIAFWFGLSFMSLNPGKLPLKRRLCCRFVSLRLILSSLFIACCIFGFLYHSHIAAWDYFRYQTNAEIELKFNDTLRYPSLKVCLRYHYLPNGKITYVKSKSSKSITTNTLTLENLFEMTPTGREAVSSCTVRDSSSATLAIVSKEVCLREFTIRKAFMGQNVCYLIVPRRGLYYSVDKVAASLTHSKEIYGVKLNNTFDHTDLITVTIFQSPEDLLYKIPVYDRFYSKRFSFRASSEKEVHGRNLLRVYSKGHHYLRLPPPFVPSCNVSKTANICYRNCIIEKVKPLGFVPYSQLLFEPIKTKILSSQDMDKNKSIPNFVNEASLRCREQCVRQPCDLLVTFTEGEDFHFRGMKSTVLQLFLPIGPEIVITSVPWMTFTDFLLYLSNCLGIWFGLSVMSFYPSNLSNKRIGLKTRDPLL